MKKRLSSNTRFLIIVIYFLFPITSVAQQTTDNEIKIINSGSPITDEMIFRYPVQFAKNKKPLFFVNNRQVTCIAGYNKDELKTITVLQPKEAIKKYGAKGKNGAILAELKDEVVKPEVVVLTNKLYYKCKIGGRIVDTTESYYMQADKKNCSILDLRDTTDIQTLYVNFKNEIRIKNLGAGLDFTSFSITGATFTAGFDGWYTVVANKEGTVKITVTSGFMDGEKKETKIFLTAVKLPTAN